jgi:hypothetical protein
MSTRSLHGNFECGAWFNVFVLCAPTLAFGPHSIITPQKEVNKMSKMSYCLYISLPKMLLFIRFTTVLLFDELHIPLNSIQTFLQIYFRVNIPLVQCIGNTGFHTLCIYSYHPAVLCGVGSVRKTRHDPLCNVAKFIRLWQK